MRRRLVAAVALAVVLPGCGVFDEVEGPGAPECGVVGGPLSPATILQAQAVPDAEVGPCINELRVGWDYSAQEAMSGEATFWLDSDRMGGRFVGVSLVGSCDPGDAVPVDDPFDRVERFVEARIESGPVEIVVVPVAPRHESNAANVAAAVMGQRIEERSVVAVVSSAGQASQRIQRALADGLPVIVIDDREVDTGTLELRRANAEPEVGISLATVLEEIEEEVDEPRYDATWYHTFATGCIIYEFDASGFGSETLREDIDDALGLFDLAGLRRGARALGYEI